MVRVTTRVAPTKKELTEGRNRLIAELREKSETSLICRSLRHAWSQHNAARLIPPRTKRDLPVIRMDFVCERGCDVVRHDTLVVRAMPDGSYSVVERLPAYYSYPEDYPIPGIPRGVQPSTIIWQEYVRRQQEEIAHAEPGERGTSD
jgi:hypothetical protein